MIESKVPRKFSEKYGNILFGSTKLSKDGFEDDTNIEAEKFHKVIEYMYGSHGKNLTKDVADTLHQLLKLKKTYPEFLEPEKYNILYRGLHIDGFAGKVNSPIRILFKKLVDLIGETPIERFKDYNSDWYELPKKMKYTPLTSIQSWTPKFGVAENFGSVGRKNEIGEKIQSIIIAKPSRNEMLFNTKFTNNISEFEEHEILRLSDKPLECRILLTKYEVKSYKKHYEHQQERKRKYEKMRQKYQGSL